MCFKLEEQKNGYLFYAPIWRKKKTAVRSVFQVGGAKKRLSFLCSNLEEEKNSRRKHVSSWRSKKMAIFFMLQFGGRKKQPSEACFKLEKQKNDCWYNHLSYPFTFIYTPFVVSWYLRAKAGILLNNLGASLALSIITSGVSFSKFRRILITFS